MEFFDVISNWEKLEKYTKHPRFLEALCIYRWWNFIPCNSPLPLYTENARRTEEMKLIIESSEDIDFLKEMLNKEKKGPYLYCVPHDCIELNSIVMGTLLSLMTGKALKDLYVLSIVPNDNSWNRHIVVSESEVEEGETFEYIHGGEGEKREIEGEIEIVGIEGKEIEEGGTKEGGKDMKRIIVYDFIYPLLPLRGNSWHKREEKLMTLTISNCQNMDDIWTSMGYINYYILQGCVHSLTENKEVYIQRVKDKERKIKEITEVFDKEILKTKKKIDELERKIKEINVEITER